MAVLSERDSGRTLEVSLATVITVQLRENPSTGYRWQVETVNGLEQIGDRFIPPGAGIGAAGLREFQFRAGRVGTHALRVKHWRDWAGSVTGRFEATIQVK
jgi:inhibitor of cysteine peptidase